MTTIDTCCTLVPYFKIHAGQVTAFKNGCDAFVEKTRSEPECMFYNFSFAGTKPIAGKVIKTRRQF